MERKPDLAYLTLVSAIEVLAHDYGVSKPTLTELDASLAESISRITDAALRQEIEQKVIARERLIGRRFREFIVRHTDSPFWEAPGRPQHGRIDTSELPELLDRIYRQRSRTLHEGEPYPPYVFLPPMAGEEIPTTDISVDKRKWKTKDFIPHPYWFERLVNHVLKNFVTRSQAKNESG